MSFWSNSSRSDSSRYVLYRWWINSVATIMLAIILAGNILLFPVPYLGFGVDFPTATITFVEPGTSAAQAGLQVDDHILRLYDRSWEEMISHPNLLSLIGPIDRPVVIHIERTGIIHTFSLAQGTPDQATQVGKLAEALLAFLCWLTGYLLGFTRRHAAWSSPLVACFWMSVGGLLGIYAFARSLSFPLMLVSQWLLLTILLPLMVYVHVWFPARPVSEQQIRIARWGLVGTWALLNVVLVIGVTIWQLTLAQLLDVLSNILPIAVLFGLVGVGVILRYAYFQVPIEKVRRQIRLIVMACVFVVCAWLLLLILPQFVFGQPLIADYWIDLISGVIPLAYLIGGLVPDLYRLDQLVARLVVHIGTTTVLAGILVAIATVFAVHNTAIVLWMVISFVVLYRPVQYCAFRLLPAHVNPTHNLYHDLHKAATKLTTTLEAPVLIDVVCEGVRTTFGEPAIALYLGDINDSNNLIRVVQEQLPKVPTTIAAGVLTNQLSQLAFVTDSRKLYTTLAQVSPAASEEVLRYPEVALWCPIRHSQGYLLGLLLLGMRGNLDSYHTQDIHEIQRLLEAAALAFGHSAAYVHQCEAEATIRHLYQRLQVAEATRAAAIARELHDEVINVNICFNIQALEHLITQVHDPDIQAELMALLESERTEAQMLRMICENIHPTGIDDPLGLPTLLRRLLERIEVIWPGNCHIHFEQVPCPIATTTQREVLGIVSEALNNVVKHAQASEIDILVQYPEMPGDGIHLTIRDNGHSKEIITPKPGHWGLRNMYERARMIGGTLHFCREAGGGTAVIVTFPPQMPNIDTAVMNGRSYATTPTV
jgi:signal transduction histidine kinase